MKKTKGKRSKKKREIGRTKERKELALTCPFRSFLVAYIILVVMLKGGLLKRAAIMFYILLFFFTVWLDWPASLLVELSVHEKECGEGVCVWCACFPARAVIR